MTHMYFSARAEGRISYGHLGRTDSCFLVREILQPSGGHVQGKGILIAGIAPDLSYDNTHSERLNFSGMK